MKIEYARVSTREQNLDMQVMTYCSSNCNNDGDIMLNIANPDMTQSTKKSV